MDIVTSTIFGLVFWGIAAGSVVLMFKLWGYPYDEDTHTSTAPKGLVALHRGLGYAYVIIYVVMMVQMVPRMWNYQIELPARTVAHLMLGISIGVILSIKISILRFFKHFSVCIPYFGMTLFLLTSLLIGLSVPFTMREYALRSAVGQGDSVFSDENIDRVKKLATSAEFPEDSSTEYALSRRGFHTGRGVLLTKCVLCHDLRTILAKPRTPSGWVQTVERMMVKPILGEPITYEDQWTVSAYLIAITPDIQSSAKIRRKRDLERKSTREALAVASTGKKPATAQPYDSGTAKDLFESLCTQCHDLDEVDGAPPQAESDIQPLIARMVENGLEIEEQEIELITRYLREEYVNTARPVGRN